mmetsp:Transcript_30798/g.76887  ORF Transcript_30798/g.76887 Transcript_30798/m.76887 type:complete len:96 (-) Transcript_30798:226-513(-)
MNRLLKILEDRPGQTSAHAAFLWTSCSLTMYKVALFDVFRLDVQRWSPDESGYAGSTRYALDATKQSFVAASGTWIRKCTLGGAIISTPTTSRSL